MTDYTGCPTAYPSDFGTIEGGYSHRNDPATSTRAAASLNLNRKQREALKIVEAMPFRTCGEMAGEYSCCTNMYELRKRVSELVQKNYIERCGEKRTAHELTGASVYHITAKGEEYLRGQG